MGAGKHRWWEELPFARAEPSSTGVGGPTALVVGGVYCGSGPTLQLELLAREINTRRGHRVANLEAELERFRQHAVAADRYLEAGKVLGAMSDDALLDELERRGPDLVAELYLRAEARRETGQNITRRTSLPAPSWRRAQGCRVCGHPSDHGGRPHSESHYMSAIDLGTSYVEGGHRVHRVVWNFFDRSEMWERGVDGGEWRLIDTQHSRDLRPTRGSRSLWAGSPRGEWLDRPRTATEVEMRAEERIAQIAPVADRWQQDLMDALVFGATRIAPYEQPAFDGMCAFVHPGGGRCNRDAEPNRARCLEHAEPAPAVVHFNSRVRGATPEALCFARLHEGTADVTNTEAAVTCPTCRDLLLEARPNRRRNARRNGPRTG
jgi:hypothetical protein